MAKYSAKRGLLGKVSPQKAGDYLTKLQKQYGDLTPELIVKKAKAISSPIHKCFTWNNTKAANKCRLDEARFLLRIVTIEVEEHNIITRAFVSVQDEEDENIYTTMETAMSDVVLRAQVLAKAKNELRAFKEKYAQLTELAKIFKDIDDLD